MKLILIICLMVFTLGFIFPAGAWACACCAEPGTYMIWTGKPGEHELAVLREMEFDKTALLYLTEADFEIIRGLDEIKSDFSAKNWVATAGEFDLVNTFTAKVWKFTLKTRSGKTGTLTLPMPTQMVQFKVDIHDTKDTGLGVNLYKEFRFKGNVQSGTGIFRAGIAGPTTYFLVFQGRGNGCDNATDFTHWHLEIDGRKAKYEFYGKLSSGHAEETEDNEENTKNRQK
jgi:hypothetical protein